MGNYSCFDNESSLKPHEYIKSEQRGFRVSERRYSIRSTAAFGKVGEKQNLAKPSISKEESLFEESAQNKQMNP